DAQNDVRDSKQRPTILDNGCAGGCEGLVRKIAAAAGASFDLQLGAEGHQPGGVDGNDGRPCLSGIGFFGYSNNHPASHLARGISVASFSSELNQLKTDGPLCPYSFRGYGAVTIP